MKQKCINCKHCHIFAHLDFVWECVGTKYGIVIKTSKKLTQFNKCNDFIRKEESNADKEE